MDRMTCKTIECFVEFTTFDEVVQIVSKHQNGLENGTHVPKIGNRDVELTISSQASLMKRLFPQAKGVRWQETPFQITRDSPIQWENYQGFVTQEELTMLCKHVEGYNNVSISSLCLFTWIFPSLTLFSNSPHLLSSALNGHTSA